MSFGHSIKRHRRAIRRHRSRVAPVSFLGMEKLEPRTLLTAELSLVASGTGVTTHTEAGLTIVEVPAGSTFQVAASISQSTSNQIEIFQLDLTNSDLGAEALSLSSWTPNAAWSGQTVFGFSFDDGNISDGVVRDTAPDPGLGAVALGTFNVTVPGFAGEWDLKTDKPGQVNLSFPSTSVSGTALVSNLEFSGFSATFDLVTVTDPGNLVIRVLPETLPTISVSDASGDEGDNPAVTSVSFGGTVRDFIGTGTTAANQGVATEQPNFENLDALNFRIANPGLAITGAVSSTLGGDNNPIFASGTNFFSDAPGFNQWYNDVAGVNTSKDQTIDLVFDGQNYIFTGLGSEAGKFYPIDDQLFGNTQGAELFGDPIPPDHNWHFTYEAHSTFVYQPGQTFTATADDDFWLYIDNARVIDRGGVNIGIERTVNLDGLGLEPGSEHAIHLFYAERHTLSAIMQLETNIPIGVSSASQGAFAEFVVSLNGASAVTTRVDFATQNGTAIAGTDYVTTAGSLVFAPGVTSQTVRVPLIGNAVQGGDKAFTLNLSSLINATPGDLSATGTITDDESAALPTVTVTASDANAAEVVDGQDANPGEFTFARTGSTTAPLDVHFSLGGGSTTNGVDHESIALTVTIPAGQDSATLPVTVINDQADEGPETVQIDLSANANYTIGGQNLAIVTIADNDPEPQLVNLSLEFNAPEGSVNGAFQVNRAGTTGDLVIHYTVAGTATDTTDYAHLPGTVTIPNGSIFAVISVAPVQDNEPEPEETVILTLTPDAAYIIGTGEQTMTIADDDQPIEVPEVSVAADQNGAEGGSNGKFTFTRTGTAQNDVTINFSVTGTAQNGFDYNAINDAVTIFAGQSSRSVNIIPINDGANENNETVIFTILSDAAYTIGSGHAGLSIIDNDGPANSSISGNVFGDTNQNGVFDAGEFAVPNSMVFLDVGSSRVDLQACKLEYSIVSPK